MRTISQFCGVPLLHTLPQELLEIIRSHSQHSLLWRCIPVLRLAAHISATTPEPLLPLPLRDLHYWERNGMLQRVTASHSPLPTLRLTVDSGGIRKVERLLDRPQYAGECTSRSAFIVVHEDSASGVVAQLKVRSLAACFRCPRRQPCCLSCRTDACVLYSQTDPLFNSGTLPRHRVSLFAERTPPMPLAPKASMPLKWTR